MAPVVGVEPTVPCGGGLTVHCIYQFCYTGMVANISPDSMAVCTNQFTLCYLGQNLFPLHAHSITHVPLFIGADVVVVHDVPWIEDTTVRTRT